MPASHLHLATRPARSRLPRWAIFSNRPSNIALLWGVALPLPRTVTRRVPLSPVSAGSPLHGELDRDAEPLPGIHHRVAGTARDADPMGHVGHGC